MSVKDPSSGWTVLHAVKLRLPVRAQGFMSGAEVRPYPQGPHIPIEFPGMSEQGVIALRETGQEPIVVLETDAVAEATGGRVDPVEGSATDRVLDARKGEAWVAWQHEGRHVRLRLLPDGELRMEVAATDAGLGAWAPPPALELPSPEIEEDLEQLPNWLQEQARDAARGTALQRATTRALLARFASASLEELLAGSSPWSAALEEWAARPSVVRESILEQGAVAADALAHQLEALQDAVAERRAGATARARAWLLDRDDLQSLLLLAEKAGERSESWDGFLASVHVLDAAARECLAVLADARVEDPRLSELSWRDPAAWWGQLC